MSAVSARSAAKRAGSKVAAGHPATAPLFAAGMTAESRCDEFSNMTALKAAQVDAFVAKPNPAQPVVLVYGADAGLVRERAEALVRASVDDINDPFSLARLEGDALAAEPSRLVEEANTIPLFGGRRAVWVKAGARNLAPAVEILLGAAPKECRVVIEAGELRKNAPLRAVCEKAKNAAALPCYPDSEKDLPRLIDAEMQRRRARPSRRRRAPRWCRCSAATAWRRAASCRSSRSMRTARSASSSRTSPPWSPTPRRWRSKRWSTRRSPASSPRSSSSSPRRATPAPRSARSCSASRAMSALLHKARLAVDDGQSVDAAVGGHVAALQPRAAGAGGAARLVVAAPADGDRPDRRRDVAVAPQRRSRRKRSCSGCCCRWRWRRGGAS